MGLRLTKVDEDEETWRTHFACRVHTRVNARSSSNSVRKSANSTQSACATRTSSTE
jgi:hypothetical protein